MPEFEYIIVGSGAGGAPLAARLALAGCKVLVLEAGSDQTSKPANDHGREISQIPALHARSTEDEELSWQFFVDHYTNPPAGPDEKRVQDPAHRGHGKIFYPRASAVGGCTIHNAMITIAGPDSEWDDLAEFVGDDCWRADEMRPCFERLERNEYLCEPSAVPRSRWRRTWDAIRWLIGYPADHTGGRHGFGGWLRTSMADISLGIGDKQLVKMLAAALRQCKIAGLNRAWTLARRFVHGEAKQALDPNHARTQAEHPAGVVLIPLAVCGEKTTIHKNSATPWVQRGRRSSPREFLLEARAANPDNLTIWKNCLVTGLIFDEKKGKRIVGVHFLRGEKLYRACPTPGTEDGTPDEVRVVKGGEVILCGGAFNTPQLLMLSGIGDPAHLAEKDIECRVELTGVGKNLQDRYEVTVVSEMKKKFSLLRGATFDLPRDGAPVDPHVKEWRETGTGLYTSNGAVLGIFKRSRPDLEKPDLFMFGIPAEFKGYALDYSDVGHKHDLFTWAILKAQTNNTDGEVRLRTTDPRDTPEINFHYFNEITRARQHVRDDDPDLLAVLDGVKFVRAIGKRAWRVVRSESHPGLHEVPEDSDEQVKKWIQREAWGHHACGTCRMGRHDDCDAVVDSRLRVRKLEGLRIVDASVFPRIPGYFIVSNIYMVAERAAELILAERGKRVKPTPFYPDGLRDQESQAIECRRRAAGMRDRRGPHTTKGGGWSKDVAGLGLSGGGIRSSTFNLGILQAMGRAGAGSDETSALRRVDFLSTVSGGGYIGSFVGRMFDRLRGHGCVHDTPADRVEETLVDPRSPALAWLRRSGNYIAPQGGGDTQVDLAIFLRNLLGMHFVVGVVLFALLGLGNVVRYVVFEHGLTLWGFAVSKGDLPIGHLVEAALGPFFSPWFVLTELLLLFFVLPRIIGYWLASQDEHERFSRPTILLVFVLLAVLLWLGVRDGLHLEPLFLAASLILAFFCVEDAWWRGWRREAAVGSGGAATRRLRTRNFLTHDLALALVLTAAAGAFALIDSLGHGLQQWWIGRSYTYAAAFAWFGAALAGTLPILRMVTGFYTNDDRAQPPSPIVAKLRKDVVAGAVAVALMVIPLVFYSFTAHAAFEGGTSIARGIGATALALVISLILRSRAAVAFVNRSSLAQVYAARLARAFLGASNPLRRRGRQANITEVIPGDDVPSIRDYRPHEAGGPLHLINVIVNQTVDFTSQRGHRDRKGENVAVSSIALSVGTAWHSLWDDAAARDGRVRARPGRARLQPVGHVAGTDHPLLDQNGAPTDAAEEMSLRRWMSISGAAVSPGAGRGTTLGRALLFGMANFRTGWWWNSGLSHAGRNGLPKGTFLRRVLYLAPRFLLTQTLLLMEWIARFPGPWSQYWYLSDGGYFENLGGYELIRRRVPRIILCDGTADPHYEFGELANLVRKARIDFHASLTPFTRAEIGNAGAPGPVGPLADLYPSRDAGGNVTAPPKAQATLFWVDYATEPNDRRSVLMYIKAAIPEDRSVDVANYATGHPGFPNESTADQFFDEEQWESYRKLGEDIASPIFTDPDWFWDIQL